MKIKIMTSLAIICALAVAGCGGSGEKGSGEETLHEHQLAQIEHQIRFIDGLRQTIAEHQARGEGARIEFEERMGLKAQTKLEVGIDPGLVAEACEEVGESTFCSELK
ncbi:MAG TPA: hypothetical protein VFL77_00890 [Solirubrobacterales bacterium]|nr:hypothetical protein [Solirubrobacterales bacterium]